MVSFMKGKKTTLNQPGFMWKCNYPLNLETVKQQQMLSRMYDKWKWSVLHSSRGILANYLLQDFYNPATIKISKVNLLIWFLSHCIT